MRSSVLASFAAVAVGVLAQDAPCLSLAAANQVADNFATLIDGYTNAEAEAFLTEDYNDYTDSVKELINGGCTSPEPIDSSVTFAGRDAFIAGQGSQPNITFDVLNVWYNCDTVFLRWKSPTPQPVAPAAAVQEQVTGIVVIETSYAGADAAQPYLINTTYSEFNSGAWLVDLTVFQPNCTSPAKRDVESRKEIGAKRGLPAMMMRSL